MERIKTIINRAKKRRIKELVTRLEEDYNNNRELEIHVIWGIRDEISKLRKDIEI